jgi:hypothetical protein
VKKLLYEQGFTIQGARQLLKSESKREAAQSALPFLPANSDKSSLREIHKGLREILGILSGKR